jgi:hypothetical protein
MNLELTDEQAAALERELRNIIDNDRYPFSLRIRTLQEIRDKIRPEPAREPLPEPTMNRTRAPAALPNVSFHRMFASLCGCESALRRLELHGGKWG